MMWDTQVRSGEALLEWGASALLAAAIGWATMALTGLLPAGAVAMAATLALGVAAMRRVGDEERGQTLSQFAVESFEAAAEDELLLDDPLAEIAPDSRVATMFVVDQETPGAMVARIADYLGDRAPRPRSSPDAGEGGGEDEDEGSADAGAALHCALANIRASLR